MKINVRRIPSNDRKGVGIQGFVRIVFTVKYIGLAYVVTILTEWRPPVRLKPSMKFNVDTHFVNIFMLGLKKGEGVKPNPNILMIVMSTDFMDDPLTSVYSDSWIQKLKLLLMWNWNGYVYFRRPMRIAADIINHSGQLECSSAQLLSTGIRRSAMKKISRSWP